MSNPDFAVLVNGEWRYRLSSFGRCALEIVACMLAKTALAESDEKRTRLNEGELHERDVARRLRDEYGYTVRSEQKKVTIGLGLYGVVVGHLDGLVSYETDGSGERVWESKGLSSKSFAEVERLGIEEWLQRDSGYRWQISGAMHAMGMGALYTVKNKESGKVLIETIDKPLVSMTEFLERGKMLVGYAKRGELPECEKSKWCWNGPYRHLHYKKGDDDLPPPPRIGVTGREAQRVDMLLGRLRELRQGQRRLRDEEDEVKESILEEFGPGLLEGEKLKAPITNGMQRRFNTNRFKREAPDVYEAYRDEVRFTKIGEIEEI